MFYISETGKQTNTRSKLYHFPHKSCLKRIQTTNFPVHKVTINSSIPGRNSSADTATRYGLDGPGIESLWGRHFPHQSRPALGSTQPPIQWVPGLSPVVKRPGRGAEHPPHLIFFYYLLFIHKILISFTCLEPQAPILRRLKKEYSYTCTQPLRLHGLFWGELNLVCL